MKVRIKEYDLKTYPISIDSYKKSRYNLGELEDVPPHLVICPNPNFIGSDIPEGFFEDISRAFSFL